MGGEIAAVAEQQQVLSISTSTLFTQRLLLLLLQLLVNLLLLLGHLCLPRLLLSQLLSHPHTGESNPVNGAAGGHFRPLQDANLNTGGG